MKWYRKAAEQGNAKAQSNLGLMYANGQGVPQERWPHLFGQNVPFLKWRLAVFCLRGGEPCGQVVNIHSIRCVPVKRPVRSGLVVERQIACYALLGCADGLVGV